MTAATARPQQQVNVPALLAELAKVKTRNAVLEAENKRYRAERKWQHDLFGNSAIQAPQKMLLMAVRYDWDAVRQNTQMPEPAPDEEPEPVTLYIEDLAKECGLSRGTIGDGCKKLEAMGALRRKKMHDTNAKTGQAVTYWKMAPTRAALDDPAHIEPPEPNNHGGKRICEHCGSDRIIQRKQLICTGCGVTLSTSEHWVNEEMDEEPQQEPQQDLAQQQQEERAAQDAEDALEPVQDATEAFTLSIPLGEDVDISNPPYSIMSSINLNMEPDPFDEGGPTYTDPFTSDDDDDDDDGEEREAW